MAYFGNEPSKQAIKIGDNTVLSSNIADGVIINADIKSDAAIAMSKTALSAGTGITLATNTLNVDAAQTQITSVGTLTGLTTGAITQNAGTFTVKNASSDSNGLKIFQDSGDASKIYNHYNGTLQLGVGSTTALTIDSSERVGVVTTSPDSIIHAKVTTNTSETIRIQNDDSLTTVGVSSDGYSFHTYQHSLYWASWDGSTWSTKGRMDSHGNLGVGTTDFNNMSSSSYAGLKVGGATLQDSGGGNGSATFLSNNAYVGGSNNMYHDGGGACSSIGMTQGDIYFYTFDGGGGSADAQWSTTSRLHISETGVSTFSGVVNCGGDLHVTNDATITSTARYWQVRSHTDNSKITKHGYDGLYTSGSQNMFLQSGQDIKFYPGGAHKVTFLDDGGITFNGDTATANALDDYEEGAISTSVTGITASTNDVSGTYTKVGRVVHLEVRVTISGKSGGSGNPYITLPFNASGAGIGASIVGAQISKNTIITGGSPAYLGLYGSTNQVYANDVSGNYIGDSDWGNGVMGFSLVYNT